MLIALYAGNSPSTRSVTDADGVKWDEPGPAYAPGLLLTCLKWSISNGSRLELVFRELAGRIHWSISCFFVPLFNLLLEKRGVDCTPFSAASPDAGEADGKQVPRVPIDEANPREKEMFENGCAIREEAILERRKRMIWHRAKESPLEIGNLHLGIEVQSVSQLTTLRTLFAESIERVILADIICRLRTEGTVLKIASVSEWAYAHATSLMYTTGNLHELVNPQGFKYTNRRLRAVAASLPLTAGSLESYIANGRLDNCHRKIANYFNPAVHLAFYRLFNISIPIARLCAWPPFKNVTQRTLLKSTPQLTKIVTGAWDLMPLCPLDRDRVYPLERIDCDGNGAVNIKLKSHFKAHCAGVILCWRLALSAFMHTFTFDAEETAEQDVRGAVRLLMQYADWAVDHLPAIITNSDTSVCAFVRTISISQAIIDVLNLATQVQLPSNQVLARLLYQCPCRPDKPSLFDEKDMDHANIFRFTEEFFLSSICESVPPGKHLAYTLSLAREVSHSPLFWSVPQTRERLAELDQLRGFALGWAIVQGFSTRNSTLTSLIRMPELRGLLLPTAVDAKWDEQAVFFRSRLFTRDFSAIRPRYRDKFSGWSTLSFEFDLAHVLPRLLWLGRFEWAVRAFVREVLSHPTLQEKPTHCVELRHALKWYEANPMPPDEVRREEERERQKRL